MFSKIIKSLYSKRGIGDLIKMLLTLSFNPIKLLYKLSFNFLSFSSFLGLILNLVIGFESSKTPKCASLFSSSISTNSTFLIPFTVILLLFPKVSILIILVKIPYFWSWDIELISVCSLFFCGIKTIVEPKLFIEFSIDFFDFSRPTSKKSTIPSKTIDSLVGIKG